VNALEKGLLGVGASAIIAVAVAVAVAGLAALLLLMWSRPSAAAWGTSCSLWCAPTWAPWNTIWTFQHELIANKT